MDTGTKNNKILFLDDEVNLIKSLARAAHRFGWEAFATSQPEEALALVREHKFGVVVSDYKMPKMSGTEFLTKVKELSPDSKRILLTGYADVGAAIQAVNQSQVYKYLTKPWDEVQMKEIISEAFREFNLIMENRRLSEEVQVLVKMLEESNVSLEKKVQERTQAATELNRRLELSLLESIKLMGEVALRKYPEVAAHCRRVAKLSVSVGAAMGLNSRDLFELKVAGYLHDICDDGKLHLEDHAVEAEKLIKLIPNLRNSAQYVKDHHERFDGSGYPRGLKAESISQGARILALVDAYDEALYGLKGQRPAMPSDVLIELKAQVGRFFDPNVFAALYEVLKRDDLISDAAHACTVTLFTLTPGMVLARDLKTRQGRKLLAKNESITKEYLARILKINEEEPVEEEIFIHKSTRTSPTELS